MTMTDSTASTTSLRYRPASAEDFSRSAKALARTIRLSLQHSQELLALAYGYSHLHELQQALKTPGRPGPYDDAEVPRSAIEHAEERADSREERFHDLICHFLDRDECELAFPFEAVDELLLFCSPANQRRSGDRISLREAVQSGLAETQGRDIWDYVIRSQDDIPYEQWLKGHSTACFTKLGQAVFESADGLADQADTISEDEGFSDEDDEVREGKRNAAIEEIERKLLKLCEEHRANPWPIARYFQVVGRARWQDEWARDYKFCGVRETTCYDRLQYGRTHAADLLPLATRLIKQAQTLASANSEDIWGYAHSEDVRRPGGDGIVLQNGLRWAGHVAMNAGQVRLAHTAFRLRADMFTETTEFLADIGLVKHVGLAVTHLLLGREPDYELDCIARPDGTGLLQLAYAAAHLRRGEREAALSALASSLAEGLESLEFAELLDINRGPGRQLDRLELSASPVREFVYRTRSYWRKHPEIFDELEAIVRNDDVITTEDALRTARLALSQLTSSDTEPRVLAVNRPLPAFERELEQEWAAFRQAIRAAAGLAG